MYSINITSNRTSRKRKLPAEDVKTFSKRDQFYTTYHHHQTFSLPDSIIFYVTKNPATRKGYQKLIKACKYFFVKNPIIVYKEVSYDGKKWCTFVNGTSERRIYDLSKFDSKFWVTGRFSVYGGKPAKHNLIPIVITKLFRFEVKDLTICNEILSYNEFRFLASSALNVELANVTVKHENGSVLALECIFEAAAKSYQFYIEFNTTLTNITSKTMKELTKIPHFHKLIFLSLNYIPETLNLDDFYEYMKKNTFTNIDLYFADSVSAAYKQRVETIIDEILQTETFDYKSPLIDFDALDRDKYDKLNNLYMMH